MSIEKAKELIKKIIKNTETIISVMDTRKLAKQALAELEPTELDIPTELWEQFIAIKDSDVANLVDDVRNYIEQQTARIKELEQAIREQLPTTISK